jgi:DNA-binding Xre family transcriptional regulator
MSNPNHDNVKEHAARQSQPQWDVVPGVSFGIGEHGDPGGEDSRAAVERVRELCRTGGGVFVRVDGLCEFADLGMRLREGRRQKRLTQQGLSEATGLSRAQIGRIERNPMRVQAWQLIALCQALDVQVTFSPSLPDASSSARRSDIEPGTS